MTFCSRGSRVLTFHEQNEKDKKEREREKEKTKKQSEKRNRFNLITRRLVETKHCWRFSRASQTFFPAGRQGTSQYIMTVVHKAIRRDVYWCIIIETILLLCTRGTRRIKSAHNNRKATWNVRVFRIIYICTRYGMI